jgi:hypothetical protein
MMRVVAVSDIDFPLSTVTITEAIRVEAGTVKINYLSEKNSTLSAFTVSAPKRVSLRKYRRVVSKGRAIWLGSGRERIFTEAIA